MSSTSSRRFFFSSSAFRWTALRWRFVCTELTGLLSSNKALLHISFQLLKRHRKFVWNWKRLLHDKFTKLGAFFSSSCFCLIASNLACLGRYFDSGFDLISRNLNLAWRFMKTFITTWSHVAKKLFFMLQALLFLATPRYSRPTPMAFGQTASTPYHRTAATLRAAASASSRWRWAFSTSSSFLPICQRIDGTIKHPIAKPNTHIHCTLWSPAQGRSYLQRKECATCIQSITYRWPCGHKLGLYLSIYIYTLQSLRGRQKVLPALVWVPKSTAIHPKSLDQFRQSLSCKRLAPKRPPETLEIWNSPQTLDEETSKSI